MLRKVVIGAVLFSLLSVAVACAGQTSTTAPAPSSAPTLTTQASVPEAFQEKEAAITGSATAPGFTGIDVVTNETVSLDQFKGSTILLNFVNYGCSTSLNQTVSAQLMVIRDLRKQRDDFIPISIFCGCCPPDVLRQFATQNGLTWPWILDTDYSIVNSYYEYLKEHGYPTLIFIDKNQDINMVTGYCDFFTLGTKIDETSQF